MKRFRTRFPLGMIASLTGQTVETRFDTVLDSVGDVAEATPSTVCFLENPRYLEATLQVNAGLLIAGNAFREHEFPSANVLWTDQPYLLFVTLVRRWLQADEQSIPAGIAASASVHPTARLGEGVRIGEQVVIGEHCEVGDHTVLDAHTVLMENCRIGKSCRLFPRVTLYPDTVLGDRVILHSGVVLGADGFGYVPYEGRQEKVPQLGNVEVGDDVEIGANTTVDRSTLQTTRIGRGTKIDNQVQIGHNCTIGEHSILCAQVGLAGGTHLGNGVYLAGQAGSAGHLTVHDGAMIGAQSGILGDVPAGAKLLGSPALDAGLAKRILVASRMLPDLLPAIRQIIKKGE